MESQALATNVQECKRCRYFTKSSLLMKIHLRRHQTQDKPVFSCEKRNLEEYQCDKCSFRTYYVRSLIEHLQNECSRITGEASKLVYRKTEMKMYEDMLGDAHCCKNCSYFTWSLFFMLNHIRTHRAPRMLFDCERSPLEEFFCEECRFSTHFLPTFRQHLRECRIGKVKPKRRNVKIKHDPELKKWYRCEHCEYRSTYQGNLKRHVFVKHEDCALKCEFCDFSTKYANHLEMHAARKHGQPYQQNWYECQLCDYRTIYKDYLRFHTKNRHTPDSEIKWHCCQLCEYKTRKRYYLKTHFSKKHAPDEEEKVTCHGCQQCGKKFDNLRNLIQHAYNEHTTFKIKRENFSV